MQINTRPLVIIIIPPYSRKYLYNANKHETPGNYNNTTLLLANAVNPLEMSLYMLYTGCYLAGCFKVL